MTARVPVRGEVVRRWFGWEGDLVGVGERVPLEGGRTAPVVERVCVRFKVAGSARVDEFDVVAKRATAGEVAALECLGVVEPVFPQLIDSGVDDKGPWIVVPFEVGEPIGWTVEPPAAVYAALARLHLRHLGRVDELPGQLPRVDDGFLRITFTEFAPSGIRRAAREAPHPVQDRALELLARFAGDERLRIGLEVLPATLLHGDVHGDNVIAPALEEASGERVEGSGHQPAAVAGSVRLIDWGSARVGPAMPDVMLAAGPAGVAAYGEAWASASGAPMDAWELATGQAWATAVSNAMFVGAVAERSAETADQMLDEAETVIDRLGRQLSPHR